MNPSEYAKAIAAATTALLIYLVAQVGLDLPEEVSAALLTLVTAGVVYGIRNRPREVER